MKHIFKFLIIIGISFLGELLHALIPLPVPASIYGMILMFAGLMLRIIPLEAVRTEGRFLIDIMPVMFIPAAVGLLDSWSALKPMLIPVAAIMVVSTFVVMGIAGKVAQSLMKNKKDAEAEQ